MIDDSPLPRPVSKPMRIMMLGLRGFPDIQGGVEAHAQHLSLQLMKLGCAIDVVVRTPYFPASRPRWWNGIRFFRVWAPRKQGLETAVHSFIGVLLAAFRRPDVLHIHAIGPALLTPLARLFGLRVVVTTHGADYDREKWGSLAKTILRLGEIAAARFAHRCIAISPSILQHLSTRYGISPALISNGVSAPEAPATIEALDQFGLQPGKYVLMVARMAEEKRQLDLIQAFADAGLQGWKLVLVGGAEHHTHYLDEVQRKVAESPNVVMTGVQVRSALAELYSNAGMFVLPSSHEGLPIVLVEAIYYRIPTLASDIDGNRAVELPANAYFPVGDLAALTLCMRRYALAPPSAEELEALRERIIQRHEWSSIAAQTLEVYRDVSRRPRLLGCVPVDG